MIFYLSLCRNECVNVYVINLLEYEMILVGLFMFMVLIQKFITFRFLSNINFVVLLFSYEPQLVTSIFLRHIHLSPIVTVYYRFKTRLKFYLIYREMLSLFPTRTITNLCNLTFLFSFEA